MSSAMAQIVDGYVKLRDRSALEQLQLHRRKLVETLGSLGGPLDVASPIKQNQDELTIIEAGLARLSAG
jgi:hypothetical protein